MTKNDYKNSRAQLMAEVQAALTSGDVDKANDLMGQVTKMDSEHEEASKAQANFNALTDAVPATMDVQANNESLTPVATTVPAKPVDSDEENPRYKSAWAKFAMGKPMDADDLNVLDSVNQAYNAEFTHQTTNTPTLIPQTVVNGIWNLAEEEYPLFADFRKFAVTGKLTFNKHDGIVSGDAQWVDEDGQADDEENKFGQLVLDGFEVNKVATVTWKMKSMSENDFITFLTQELADRIGVALGVGASHGTGVKQAKGVITLLNEETDKPQIKTYTDQVTYQDLTGAMALIHSTLANGTVIYANNATIWNQLANVVDTNNRPIFVPDTNAGGVGNIFGRAIKADAGLADGEILIGNAAGTGVMNTNEGMSVAMEDHVKSRKTDYGAYAIVDFGLLTTKGFALLTTAPKA